MKILANIFLMTATVLVSCAVSAQTAEESSLTRAQVREQLVALETAGYNPVTSTS